jgi:transcriptional regulator with XRE-family HTH domain
VVAFDDPKARRIDKQMTIDAEVQWSARRAFAQLLDEILNASKWKNDTLAAEIGVSHAMISYWRRAKYVPSLDDFKQLLKTLFGSDPGASGRDEFCRAYDAARQERDFEKRFKASVRSTTTHTSATATDDLKCIGDISKGIDWFMQFSRNATHVSNTVFTRTSRAMEHIVKEGMKDWNAHVIKLLKEGCTWEEIVLSSVNENGSVIEFREQVNSVIEFYKKLDDKRYPYRHRFIAKELHGVQLPLFQCLIVKHGSNAETVLFGWLLHGSEKQLVYVSSGARTVAFFKEYYMKLFELATPLCPPAR